jgi:hypothetical protein
MKRIQSMASSARGRPRIPVLHQVEVDNRLPKIASVSGSAGSLKVIDYVGFLAFS